MQDAVGKDGHHSRVGHAAKTHRSEQGQRGHHRGMAADKLKSFSQRRAGSRVFDERLGGQAHGQQPGNHGKKTDAVQQEAPGFAD